ncbi:hypothetical protein G5B46_22025 [Caulobacter sp. 602-2]|uniref:Uncharacterized protein n=1 Tax=Caulobacter sp. 602-2 TaxID=2710887 RepID=A0A6G4R3J6_9CAUL|nr:hypothetical protein [Caulobacter sp. 602-2]NGM52297.1 hypothetical protein [Caulobacter sp. 602-2]
MSTEANVRDELDQDLKDLTLQTLCRKYAGEASIHRNILMSRGTGVTGTWRDFRAFLGDIGPKPSENHVLVLINRLERTYGPGRARWMTPDEQSTHEAEFDRVQAEKKREAQKLEHEAAAIRRAKAPNAPNFGQFTPMAGQQVSFTDVAKKLNIPVAALSKTMAGGRSADELVKRAASAAEVINTEASWLPPDPARKANFFEAFRIWHMQVQPQFSRAATPTFLFLYIALPVMKECRDELVDLNLWNPLGQRALTARDNHISWKKYCEFMPRAQVAMMEIPIYATYSLLSDLDALCERIVTAEKRFREGPQKVIHTHRAA